MGMTKPQHTCIYTQVCIDHILIRSPIPYPTTSYTHSHVNNY